MSLSTECATALLSFRYPSKDLKNKSKKQKQWQERTSWGSQGILNHPFAHNHNSLRHITAHRKSSHLRITTILCGIPLRILNLPFGHNHNTLHLVRKSDCSPYNVTFCWLESCLARSFQAHSLRQQLDVLCKTLTLIF